MHKLENIDWLIRSFLIPYDTKSVMGKKKRGSKSKEEGRKRERGREGERGKGKVV